MPSSPQARTAFTLVELVVVMAVIAVVAGLIVTAALHAREQADASQCVSNLRQLVAANYAYAAEHENRFVPAQEPSNLVRWHGIRSSVAEKFDDTRGPLAPYLGGEGGVKFCPTLRRMLPSTESFESGAGGYGYNAAYLGGTPRDTWTPELTSAVQFPERTVMFCDTAFARADGVQEYPYCEPWQQERPPELFRGHLNASVHFRHHGLANVAWCDGHVTAEPPSVLDAGNAYGGDQKKYQIGWFGPGDRNGYWRPY